MTSPSSAEYARFPQIPRDLLPTDGRFGSGPSKVTSEAVRSLVSAPLGTSHRQPPVRALVSELRSGLAALWGLPEGHQVVLGNGGSTLFWDLATFSLIHNRSQHAVFGEFGSKFHAAAAAAPFLDRPDLRESPVGSSAVPAAAPGIDFYAQVHNETSTGVVGAADRPRGIDPGALLALDATSAAGGIEWDPAATDVYYFAPQKGFASDGGLWLAVLSSAAIERASAIKASGRWIPTSLDLTQAIDQSSQDQTLNTPAIATLALMIHQLRWMLDNGGMAFTTARCNSSAGVLYSWAEKQDFASPFVTRTEDRSPVVGTIDFSEQVDAAWVAGALRHNGVVDTEPYRKLGRNQLRIGMYPAVDPADVEALTACIDWLVEHL